MDLSGFEIIDVVDMEEAATRAVKLVHDGDADIYMKGALDSKTFLRSVLNTIIIAAASVLLIMPLALLLAVLLNNPLTRFRNAFRLSIFLPVSMSLVVASMIFLNVFDRNYGVLRYLMGLAGWKWGAEQKEFVVPMSYQVTHEPFPGMIINDWAIAVFITAALVMVLLFLFFKYTKLGIAMRATQQNQHAAKIMGIRVERVFSIAWGFSSLIGTIAAMFFASRSTLDPGFMLEPFLRAFAAAVLGGLMSIPGVFIGGELLGLIENFFGYVWPEWKPIVAFVVIVLVLCIRPSGLFAKHYVKKV